MRETRWGSTSFGVRTVRRMRARVAHVFASVLLIGIATPIVATATAAAAAAAIPIQASGGGSVWFSSIPLPQGATGFK